MRIKRIALARAAVAACLLAPSRSSAAKKADAPLEVVVKGEDKKEPTIAKPLFDIPFDPYESVRESLQPDEALLLSESPEVSSASVDAPLLLDNKRLVQPWNDGLLGKTAITRAETLNVRLKFGIDEELPNRKDAAWTFSIVDEDGRLFQRFKSTGDFPETVPWSGRSDSGRWLAAGHDYSSVLNVTYAGKPPRTLMGYPLRFSTLTHLEANRRIISLDTSVLFGPKRDQPQLTEAGRRLMIAAADVVRREAYRRPIRIRVFSTDVQTAQKQARDVEKYLAWELLLPAGRTSISVSPAAPSATRLELLLESDQRSSDD